MLWPARKISACAKRIVLLFEDTQGTNGHRHINHVGVCDESFGVVGDKEVSSIDVRGKIPEGTLRVGSLVVIRALPINRDTGDATDFGRSLIPGD